MELKNFYVDIDAGIDWFNVNVAKPGSGIEKVNRKALGLFVYNNDNYLNNAPKMSLWQNRKQIPGLEEWLLIKEFLKGCPEDVLIVYYD